MRKCPTTEASAFTNFAFGYTVVDLLGYYNFNRNTTLNLGIFNLFNERYIEWSDVRGINASDRFLDLYTQPGINFAASLTVRF